MTGLPITFADEPLCRRKSCADLRIVADGDGVWCQDCLDQRREDAAEARYEASRDDWMWRSHADE